MGNLSSSTHPPRSPATLPPRSPATASQHVSSDDSVYETYQVPFGLAREINRLCSEFHKLQQAVQSGGPLPSEAVFQVDLIQIFHLTNPEAHRHVGGNESLSAGQRSQFSHQPSSGANHAPPPSDAQWSQQNPRAAKFRDPSMPLILRLDKKQLLLLQESSSSNAFYESDVPRPSNLSRSSALSNDTTQSAATSGAEGRANGPRVRLAAASQAIIGANSLQKGGLQYSSRQQVQQQFLNHAEEAAVRSDDSASMAHASSAATFARQSEFRDFENDSGSSAYRNNLHFDSPHVDVPRTWTHSSGNDRVSSLTHRPPASHESVGPSASSVESRVDHGSSTPAYARSTYHGAPEAGRLQWTDADARGVLSASASPNSVNSFASSQSLVSDDVEAKRKILAEVRFWRDAVCS